MPDSWSVVRASGSRSAAHVQELRIRASAGLDTSDPDGNSVDVYGDTRRDGDRLSGQAAAPTVTQEVLEAARRSMEETLVLA
ncbi:MAG TPA: hypothetical protein VFO14_15965 [Vicinamibacterales bacterium]|nr:hypothetical protein [Vicinamibacterales bacterium]